MQNPVHPGAIVRNDYLAEVGLSVTGAAKKLGVGNQALCNLVNERSAVSIEMAHRLSEAFGSTLEQWLRMQLTYDLAQSKDLAKIINVHRVNAGSQR